MEQIILAFITGLTTGGLSCLAVQGGLLASSLAQQIEQDMLRQPVKRRARKRKAAPRSNTALPIGLFLLAKLAAYTLLGALLGLVGSFITVSPLTRAVLLILIGVFMIGNGMRMLNVHPIFRYFNIEPPKFITRYIRRSAKGDRSEQGGVQLATPLFLGALTVLIPCGVTQAMMAVALGTGSPAQGAAMMFAFTLGTSPVFFLVAYLTMHIGARLEKYFLRFVAVVVLVLGFVSLDSGLNVMGSPFSSTSLARNLFPAAQKTLPDMPVTLASSDGMLRLTVANQGYFPEMLKARANTPLTLELVTEETYSCARSFMIPAIKYFQVLPATGRVSVEIPPQKPGTVMRFTCSMGMFTGQIVFE